jgi:2,3-dihydroxyphenylpropionate 1,2-dioxygenase
VTAALVCVSHSPLMGYTEPAPGVRRDVDLALQRAREFVEDYRPEVIVLFAPDHYNGVFYDMMPPFAIGAAATSIGDYDSPAGPLLVDRDSAHRLAQDVLNDGIDVTLSERLYVDHGFAQPLQLLLGGLRSVPVVPVFINGLAEPLGPPKRSRLLGEAIGRSASRLDKRVLFLGSGGLSHDPPAPRLDDPSPEIVERIIQAGRRMTPQERAEREMRTVAAGRAMAEGTSTMQPLNPDWDRHVLETLANGDFGSVDAWTTKWFIEEAGHSSHEVRTWIAAYAALAACGPYAVSYSFYREIPHWIVGFGVTLASSTTDDGHREEQS